MKKGNNKNQKSSRRGGVNRKAAKLSQIPKNLVSRRGKKIQRKENTLTLRMFLLAERKQLEG